MWKASDEIVQLHLPSLQALLVTVDIDVTQVGDASMQEQRVLAKFEACKTSWEDKLACGLDGVLLVMETDELVLPAFVEDVLVLLVFVEDVLVLLAFDGMVVGEA